MSSLRITPDPTRPHGGAALIYLPRQSDPQAEILISVQNRYSGLWLAPTAGEDEMIQVGEANWQAEPHAYGPYPVEVANDRAFARIGPEIVNKLEEFAPLTLLVNDHAFETTWPEDVFPRVGAALTGSVHGIARPAKTGERGDLVGHATVSDEKEAEQDPQPQEVTEDAPEIDGDPAGPIDELAQERRPFRYGLLAAVVCLLLALFIVTALIIQDEDPPVARQSDENVETVVETTPDCSFQALRSRIELEAIREALNNCGAQATSDTALMLLEQASGANDAAALIAFGKLYDEAEVDTLFEEQFGLNFPDDPSQAAAYYARANDLGDAAATTLLSRICTRLTDSTDVLSQGAYNDYCS
ncbi:MAG: hypothetical protein AAF755_07870 [Pseudomonadota bacterium]